jgi:hypothetical protein
MTGMHKSTRKPSSGAPGNSRGGQKVVSLRSERTRAAIRDAANRLFIERG